ncbi:hypothetical protein [Halosegnis longus]|uniref:Uncharacterized protein n=1 Tax=Halosegnis longus TaxID=2216012 RepID=A0AAJ4RAA6_9EURY|nr:hypothetical protein Nmn1133_10935 [Salella cibi]
MSENSHIETALDESLVARAGAAIRATLASSPPADALRRLERAVEETVRNSWLYRWLTAEPDPTVVTIDLRETHTVGPVLALLEWVVTPLWTRWQQSALREKSGTIAGHGQRIVESSRVATWLARLFVPPEPPDAENGDGDAREDAQAR